MIGVPGTRLEPETRPDPRAAPDAAGKCDVLVVGGGVAGVSAALAAARTGARTVLVERRNFVGGNAAMGLPLLGFHSITGKRGAAGLAEELVSRLKHYQAATDAIADARICSFVVVEPGWVKVVAFQMLERAGVEVLFHSVVTGVLADGGPVRGVVVNGRRALHCKTVVDASGDGVIAAMAAAPFEIGDANDGWAQPSTLIMRLGGADTERARRAIIETDQQIVNDAFLESIGLDKRRTSPWASPYYYCNGFRAEVAQAKADGVLPPDFAQARAIFANLLAPGEVIASMAKVVGRNAAADQGISDAEADASRLVAPIMEFFTRYLPGFENCHLIDLAPQIGVRETRRIIGEHVLSDTEILAGARFRDSIGLGTYYLDVHPPRGGDKTIESMQYPLEPFELPYRMLLPRDVEGLVLAGRCAAANQRAFGSVRVSVTCMVMGQAAGTAAALAAKSGSTPRQTDLDELQGRLVEAGALLHPEQADERFDFPSIAP